MTTARNRKVKTATQSLEAKFGPLSFADLILSARETDELTQVEMAKKLGVSRQRLCDFEKGRRLPSAKSAEGFAKRLGFSPAVWVQILLQDQLKKEDVKLKVSVAS